MTALRRWVVYPEFWLGIGALSGYGINAAIFYPGFMSPDTLSQLHQAMTGSFADWHPPFMAFLWRHLIGPFGISSMLLLQLVLLWITFFGLSVFVYQKTHSIRYAALLLAAPFLPNILSISGVVWKDIFVAGFLGVACMLIFFEYHIRSWWVTCLTIGLILVTYLFRVNVLPALLPLLWLVFYSKKFTIVKSICIAIGLVGGVVVFGMVFNRALHVRPEHPTTAIYIDAVTNISDVHSQDPDLEAILVQSRKCLGDFDARFNVYWLCLSDEQRLLLRSSLFDELSTTHKEMLKEHLFGYIKYRMHTFVLFLFPSNSKTYYWHPGINANEYGLMVSNPALVERTKTYSDFAGLGVLGFVFKPWPYVLLLTMISIGALRLKKSAKRWHIMAVAASGLIYIGSYFPAVVAYDYRYIYWSVFATILAGTLYLIETSKRSNSRRSKK